jgi:hypothetical protein
MESFSSSPETWHHASLSLVRSIMRVAIVVPVAFLLFGCAHGPSKWALRVVEESRCGMTVVDVERLAGRQLREMSGRTPRGTHVVRRGLSAVWFDFVNGGLVAVQPAWTSAMKKDDDGPRRDLCGK